MPNAVSAMDVCRPLLSQDPTRMGDYLTCVYHNLSTCINGCGYSHKAKEQAQNANPCCASSRLVERATMQRDMSFPSTEALASAMQVWGSRERDSVGCYQDWQLKPPPF